MTAEISNIGPVTGDGIIQLYVRDLVGEVTRPVMELKDFKRITLKPKENRTIRFDIPAQDLGFHGLEMEYIVEPGEYRVFIGTNSRDVLDGNFQVVK